MRGSCPPLASLVASRGRSHPRGGPEVLQRAGPALACSAVVVPVEGSGEGRRGLLTRAPGHCARGAVRARAREGRSRAGREPWSDLGAHVERPSVGPAGLSAGVAPRPSPRADPCVSGGAPGGPEESRAERAGRCGPRWRHRTRTRRRRSTRDGPSLRAGGAVHAGSGAPAPSRQGYEVPFPARPAPSAPHPVFCVRPFEVDPRVSRSHG